MFNIGDWVIDANTNSKVRVVDKRELWNYTTYEVYDPINKESYWTLEETIKDKNDLHFNIYYFKYLIAAARIKNEIINGKILSPIGDSILPLPHQIYALNRVLSNSNIRYILADEVGLGKTIEAGLIIKELKARGLIKRILIVCPKGLITQWEYEMKEKFNEKFNIILPEDFDSIKRIYGRENIWMNFSQVICPMDSVKPLEKRSGWDVSKINEYNRDRIDSLGLAGWDLIIVDEAHRIAGSSSDVARYQLGKVLSEASPYLLLLTATPHQGKTDAFLRLVRLLDKNAFPDEKAIIREQVAPYVIRTEKREATDADGNLLFKRRITKIVNIHWDNRHSLQKELYEKITVYVCNGYNKARKERKNYIGFLMILMQRLVTSSTRAIRINLERRLEILENNLLWSIDLIEEEIWETDSQDMIENLIYVKSQNIKKEINELKELLVLAKQAEHQYLDVKVEALLNTINDIQIEQGQKVKILIFTEFVATQMYLKELLEKNGFKISILNGSLNMEERNEALNYFKNDADILISTDAGGEGLNLQFCNIVINYDLPWNPMKIEQRIGRVDRIGQKKDVLVFNFILADTVEYRVRQVLEEKLKVIFEQFGVDKLGDVLDSVETEIDFTDVFISSVTDSEFLDYKIEKLENKIKEKTEKIQKVKDLFKDDKIIRDDLVLNLDNTQLETWINQMVINKRLADGKGLYTSSYTFTLQDDIVKEMLDRIPQHTKTNEIPIISIDNINNENGFWTLWEISINDSNMYKKIFPIYMNDKGIVRMISSKYIWDAFLNQENNIRFIGYKSIEDSTYEILYEKAKDIAYQSFIDMKTEYLQALKKEKNKRELAFTLREEAINRIGLKNVRKHRLEELGKEKELWHQQMKRLEQILPILKPIYIIYLE